MRDLSLNITVQATQAKAELRETERHIENTSKAARDLDKAVSEAEKRLDKSFAEAEKSAKKLEDQVESLGRKKKDTAASTDLLASKIRNVLVGGALLAAIKSSADYADRLEELSVQTGMSIKALQQFDYAAKANGSSLEAVTRAAGTFQDRLAGGDKSVLRALERLSISYEVIRHKTPDQQMLELARAVSAIKDPAERVNVAMDLFGRTGAGLIPTLKALTEEGGKTGVMTEDSAKKFGQLSDALVKFKDVGLGTIANVLTPLAGGMMAMANATEWAAKKMSGFLASATGPIGWYNDMMNQFGDPSKMPDMNNTAQVEARLAIWRDFLEKGKANNAGHSGESPAVGLFGTEQLFGYTNEIERQLNDQLKEQARLHKARGDAAEEAARKAKKAAAEELDAWNDLLKNNRALLADAQRAIGEDFNLFFGRQFTPRGGVYQSDNYWGQTDVPTVQGTSLAGVSGTMPGFQSAGNIAAWVNQRRQIGSQEQWNRQWLAAYGDYSSWGEGVTSAMNAFSTYGQAAQDLARGDTEVLRATNIMGRGNRAKAGMMAGAAEGGKYGGPYGAAGGAVIGAIIGAARNPMFEDIYNRVGANFDQRGISEDLARQIEDVAKNKFEKNRQAAEIYSLPAILKERPIDAKNVTQMTARLHDAFSMRQTGAFGDEELQTTLDSSFGAFADYYNRIGGLADKTFTDIIRLQRDFGVESQAVAQYVNQQTERALTGLTTFLEHGTIQSADAAKGIMGAAVLIFDELRKGPEGVKGAMAALAPVIEEIDLAIQKFGVEADVVFNDMRSLLGTMADEDVMNAVTAVEGLGETMIGLSNAVLLNEDTYRGLSRAIVDTRNNLVAQGHDGEHVNRLMQRELQTIWELQQDWGYAVDETTQALLDQATAQGIVGDKFRSAEQQMTRSLDAIATTLGEIRDLLRDDLPAAADDAANGVNDALDRIPTERDFTFRVNYDDPGAPGGHAYVANGGYVGAYGVQYLAMGGKVLGFRPRGSDTVPAMLTPGEGVLSRRGMQALGELNRGERLGGGDVFHITVNGAQDAEAVAEEILRKVTQKRKLSRGRRAA